MRHPASEKLEIIRLVERSQLSARRTLVTLGILAIRQLWGEDITKRLDFHENKKEQIW
jgi:hypothetical protein